MGKLRIRIATGVLLGLLATQALAAPWQGPDDPRVRYALQKLADRGHLNRGVTTWPIMWPSVQSGLESANTAHADNSVTSALAYVNHEKAYQSRVGGHDQFIISGSTDTAFATSFGNPAIDEAEAQLRVEWVGERWAARVAPAYTVNPEDDEELRLDDSYLAGTLGNWVLGAGAIDRWWGPGWGNSLILSTNARPMPAVWLNRRDPSAFEPPWLSWIGSWQFTVFGGQYERDRTIPKAKLLGMRLTFRPVDGLDIGFSRAIMVGGEGRPENASTLWNAIIGKDNGQLGENDPGNQIASVDIRYGFGVGKQSMSFYAQMMGEDEAGAFPARKSWLLGTDWTTAFANHEQQWYLEYVNTSADDFLGNAMPNISYEHSTYNSGYRYFGRNMAAWVDGDAEGVTLGGYNFFPNGNSLGFSVSHTKLNKDNTSRVTTTNPAVYYNTPSKAQNVTIASASYGMPAFYGWLTLSGHYSDNKIELLSGDRDRWAAGAQWQYRF